MSQPDYNVVIDVALIRLFVSLGVGGMWQTLSPTVRPTNLFATNMYYVVLGTQLITANKYYLVRLNLYFQKLHRNSNCSI